MANPAPALAKRAERKQALQRMCFDVEGRLTRDAKIILAYLSRQCNGKGRESFSVSPTTGQIDQTAMVRMAGRREVFDMIVDMLSINLVQRQNPED